MGMNGIRTRVIKTLECNGNNGWGKTLKPNGEWMASERKANPKIQWDNVLDCKFLMDDGIRARQIKRPNPEMQNGIGWGKTLNPMAEWIASEQG